MSDFWNLPKPELFALTADAFAVQRTVQTRWRDNDQYGHVNNALYYEFFDTAINGWLLDAIPAALDPQRLQMFVAESSCKYLRELAFPSPLLLGLNVARLGSSSITYELGIFAVATEGDSAGEPGPIAALGRWTHVVVDTETHRPMAIPDDVRPLLEAVTA